jgi:hypothetical protein
MAWKDKSVTVEGKVDHWSEVALNQTSSVSSTTMALLNVRTKVLGVFRPHPTGTDIS